MNVDVWVTEVEHGRRYDAMLLFGGSGGKEYRASLDFGKGYDQIKTVDSVGVALTDAEDKPLPVSENIKSLVVGLAGTVAGKLYHSPLVRDPITAVTRTLVVGIGASMTYEMLISYTLPDDSPHVRELFDTVP